MNTSKNDNELESEEQWDWGSGERVEPRKPRRSVVSVPFSGTELSLVAGAARRARQPVSGYVRNAALEKARGGHLQPTGWSAGNRNWAVLYSTPAGATSGAAQVRGERPWEGPGVTD